MCTQPVLEQFSCPSSFKTQWNSAGAVWPPIDTSGIFSAHMSGGGVEGKNVVGNSDQSLAIPGNSKYFLVFGFWFF